jgi:hypothetical protein
LRASAAAKTPGGVGVDTDLARQEFISGGQQVSLQEYVGVSMQLQGVVKTAFKPTMFMPRCSSSESVLLRHTQHMLFMRSAEHSTICGASAIALVQLSAARWLLIGVTTPG